MTFTRTSRATLFFGEKRLQLHRNVQRYIQNLFPAGSIQLEYAFPCRIADAISLERRVVFEVQCSRISLKEVKERNAYYEFLGFDVVWILHDKNFNHAYLSPAEHYLREKGRAFYTNITITGHGGIYDQFEIIKRRYRFFRSSPLPVDLVHWRETGRAKAPPEMVELLKKKGLYYEKGVFARIFSSYRAFLAKQLRAHALSDWE